MAYDDIGAGFGGGGFIFALFALVILFGGLGGGGGLFGNRNAYASDVSYQALQAGQANLGTQIGQVQDQMSANQINSQLCNMSRSIDSNFASLQNSTNQGFAGLQNSMNQGFAGLNTVINTGFANAALQNNQNTQAIIQGINTLSTKLDSQTINALSAENANLKTQNALCHQTNYVESQINGLATQLASCCCDLKAAIARIPTTTTATT